MIFDILASFALVVFASVLTSFFVTLKVNKPVSSFSVEGALLRQSFKTSAKVKAAKANVVPVEVPREKPLYRRTLSTCDFQEDFYPEVVSLGGGEFVIHNVVEAVVELPAVFTKLTDQDYDVLVQAPVVVVANEYLALMAESLLLLSDCGIVCEAAPEAPAVALANEFFALMKESAMMLSNVGVSLVQAEDVVEPKACIQALKDAEVVVAKITKAKAKKSKRSKADTEMAAK